MPSSIYQSIYYRPLYFYLLLTVCCFFLPLWFFCLSVVYYPTQHFFSMLTALLPEWWLPSSFQHYSYLSFLLSVDCPHQFICCLLPLTIILLHVDWFQLIICCLLPSSVFSSACSVHLLLCFLALFYCTVILLLVDCFYLSITRLIWPFLLPSSVYLLCRYCSHLSLIYIYWSVFCDYPPHFFCLLTALICQFGNVY